MNEGKLRTGSKERLDRAKGGGEGQGKGGQRARREGEKGEN